jgi:hypothetical protein
MVIIKEQRVFCHKGIPDDGIVEIIPLLRLFCDFRDKGLIGCIIIDLISRGVEDPEIEIGVTGLILTEILGKARRGKSEMEENQ